VDISVKNDEGMHEWSPALKERKILQQHYEVKALLFDEA
jgi:hypothetical protein